MTRRIVLAVLMTAIVITVVPQAASAQTNNQLGLEIKTLDNVSLSDLAPIFITDKTDETPAEPEVDPNIAILQNYLEKKGSPLAPYAEHILKHENWKLVLAISNGESTMCKKQLYNNCWGVGGAWNLKRYTSFADGFTDVDRLITTKYVAQGLTTPDKIVRKYVGNPSASWVRAVSQTLNQLNQLPLSN
jgi:hypothetical protein